MKKLLVLLLSVFISTSASAEDRVVCKLDQYHKKSVVSHELKTQKDSPKELFWQKKGVAVEVNLFGKDTIWTKIIFKDVEASSIANVDAKFSLELSKTTTSLYYKEDSFNLYCGRTEASKD